MFKKFFLLILTIIFIFSAAKITYSQDSLNLSNLLDYKIKPKTVPSGDLKIAELKAKDSNKISLSRTLGFTVFTLGATVFLHYYQQNAWWSGEREHFHIKYNWVYSLQMNNLGHMFVGSLIGKTMSDAFDWCGFKPTMAKWMGTLFSFFYMTDIEIEDGFAKKWGFSPGDQTSAMIGHAWDLGQYYLKPMQEVTLKWSYRPTHDPYHKGDFPDDYNGQTFWLSFNVYDFFPKSIQTVWPKFLNLAVGYGVDGYDDYRGDGRIQNFYFSFDYDFRRIIPGDSKFMHALKNFINNFKFLPAPGLRWNFTQHRFEFTLHF